MFPKRQAGLASICRGFPHLKLTFDVSLSRHKHIATTSFTPSLNTSIETTFIRWPLPAYSSRRLISLQVSWNMSCDCSSQIGSNPSFGAAKCWNHVRTFRVSQCGTLDTHVSSLPFRQSTLWSRLPLTFPPGKLTVNELFFEVPKDYGNPDRGTIQLFARSVSRYEKPTTIISEEERKKKAMVNETTKILNSIIADVKCIETLVRLSPRWTRIPMFSSPKQQHHKCRTRQGLPNALPWSERNWSKHSNLGGYTGLARRCT